MALTLFSLGKLDSWEDPDGAQELLEQWLKEFLPLYFESEEYQQLSKANQKAEGQWFSMFMELFQGYIGGDLKRINKSNAEEIMLELFPRKMICSDSQAKTIVPDILAAWQFLDRTFNSGKTKKLKHAHAVIKFLTSIRKDYLDIYHRRPSHLVQRFMANPEGFPKELQQLFQGVMEDIDETFEEDEWIIDLIKEVSTHLTQINKQSEPPGDWLLLYQFPELSQFLRYVCLHGFDDSSPKGREAVTALLSFGLQNLFMQIRQKNQKALYFWEQTERNIMATIEVGDLSLDGMKVLLFVLSQHKQFLSVAFMSEVHQWMLENTEELPADQVNPEALKALFERVAAEVNDEFELVSVLKERLGFLPPEGFEILAPALLETGSKAVDTFVLMLLDDNLEKAHVIGSLLRENAKQLSERSLSRLIRVRNWLHESVQEPVDKLIREARKAGVVPVTLTSQNKTEIIETWMSGVDGSGAQGVMMIVRDQAKFRLIGFALKEQVGVVDALVTPPASRISLNRYIKLAREQAGVMEKVSADLVCRELPFFINLNKNCGIAIDHELVQAMELMGIENWNPGSETLTELYGTGLQEQPSSDEIAQVQKRSSRWTSSTIGESWFENSDQLHALRPVTHQRYPLVFEQVMEPVRHQWGERMVRMALWSQSALNKRRQAQSRDFAVVSWLLNHSELPVSDVELMKGIVKKSI